MKYIIERTTCYTVNGSEWRTKRDVTYLTNWLGDAREELKAYKELYCSCRHNVKYINDDCFMLMGRAKNKSYVLIFAVKKIR